MSCFNLYHRKLFDLSSSVHPDSSSLLTESKETRFFSLAFRPAEALGPLNPTFGPLSTRPVGHPSMMRFGVPAGSSDEESGYSSYASLDYTSDEYDSDASFVR